MKADPYTLLCIATVFSNVFYGEFIAISIIFYACDGSGPIKYVSGPVWLLVCGVSGWVFMFAMVLLACSEKFLVWEILLRIKAMLFAIWWGLGFHLVAHESEMFCTLMLVHAWIAVFFMPVDMITSLAIFYCLPLPTTRRIQTV